MAGDTTTLTYLFSDLEGSTRLWEQHPESMHDALARHDTILREAVEDAGGSVVKTTGDGLMAAFDDASAAVTASLRAQRALRDEPWGETGPLRVRIGMHIGESQPRAGDFYGSDVNRAARVMAAAHGGQILLTAAVAERLRGALPDSVGLRGLGSHRLKDLAGPAELLQVTAPDLGHDFPPLNTLDARPNNLPTQASAFLGRDDVLEQLEEILDTGKTRLVTLTGPGGTGKTRLALQAAAAQIDRHRDGVFFVDLSAERDPRPAFAAIIRTVGIGASAEDPPLEVLKSGLEGSELLLVLDNLEQVTAIGPGLVELLAHCPDVTILGTSREALRVRGEQLLPTPPLSLPMSNDGAVTVKGAVESEAVRLFEERASEIRPDFAITEDNVADVVAICRRLDGLPLAIELAAARINLFGVDELRTRLAERFDVLKGGARDLPERQQTLRSTIEWSDDLLSEEERRILWLFSVFVGARVADVEATAERVPTLGVGDVLEPLGSLVDKSLLRNTVEVSGQRRLTMLQTIRAYASEQLAAHPDLAAAVRRAHAEHYTAVANQWRGQLARKDREAVLAALSDELGNIRAAWDHWVEEQDVVRLNELIEPLWGYHDAKGEYGAAVELANDLLAVLEIQPETPERIRDEIALEMSLARSLIAVHGYTAEVERKIREAVERSGSGPRTPQRFPVLRSLATLHLLRMEFEDATAIGRELLDIAEEQGDRALLSEAHLVYGLNTSFGEDLEEGLGHLDRSIELFDAEASGLVKFRVGPNPGVVAHIVSGLLLWMLGFPDRALLRAKRGLELARQIGHPYSLAYGLFHAAVLDLWRQDLETVAVRGEELLRVANEHDYPIWRALALVLRGTARSAFGEVEEGLAEVDRGFALYEGLSTPPVFWPMLLMIRATGRLLAGQPAAAAPLVEAAADAIPDGDIQIAQVQILSGDVLMAAGDTTAAIEQYRSALDLGAAGGIRIGALEAATRLAAALQGSDRGAEARDRLQGIYDTFTEGFETAPLVAARTVLSDR